MRPGWTALALSAVLASGAQAQELELSGPDAPCPSVMGCQLDLDAYHGSAPDQLCASEEPLSVYSEGETVWAVIRSGPAPHSLSGSLFTRRFQAIGHACWAAAWRLPYLTQSRLQFYGFDADGRRIGQAVFAGHDTGPEPLRAELSAQIVSTTLWDERAGLERRVHVYAPPGLGAGPAPVLILPDGQAIRQYASIVQALIDDGRIPPLLIAAIEARMDNPFARDHEYIPGLDGDQHDAFTGFFEYTFIPWVEAQNESRMATEGWIIFGASSSAVFALSTAKASTPIGHIIAASPMAADALELPDASDLKAEFHISAGLYEASFHTAASQYADQLRATGSSVHTYCPASGHDRFSWDAAFEKALLDIFNEPQDAAAQWDLPACRF